MLNLCVRPFPQSVVAQTPVPENPSRLHGPGSLRGGCLCCPEFTPYGAGPMPTQPRSRSPDKRRARKDAQQKNINRITQQLNDDLAAKLGITVKELKVKLAAKPTLGRKRPPRGWPRSWGWLGNGGTGAVLFGEEQRDRYHAFCAGACRSRGNH
jgi:hypothetical protein